MKNRQRKKECPKQPAIQVTFDATTISDDDFPVSCPTCRYRLKDVARGACPECGNIFHRKALLITQYGLDLANPTFAPTSLDKYQRAVEICFYSAPALFLLLGLAQILPGTGGLLKTPWVAAALILLFLLTNWLKDHLKWRIDRRNKSKQQRILKAINAETSKLNGEEAAQTNELTQSGRSDPQARGRDL